MNTMQIKQFKDFKREYRFDLINELTLHRKTIPAITFNSDVQKMSKDIPTKIMNSNRPTKHKETTILYSYILYLCNFMKGYRDNFDKVYQYIQKDKNNIKYFDPIILKEIRKREKISVTL